MVSTSWRPTRCSGQDIPPNAGVEPGDDPHKHPSTRDETATAKPRAMRSNCTRVATRDQTGSYRHKEQPAHRGGPAMPKHPIEASQAMRRNGHNCKGASTWLRPPHNAGTMHTGSRPKEWNATGDLGTNHSVPAHTNGGLEADHVDDCDDHRQHHVGQALGAASTL